MRKLVLVATTASLAAAAVLVPVQTANAATNRSPGCVTRAEYRSVHKGWTKARVTKTFGTAGHREAIARSAGYGSEVRSYKTCSTYSAVSVAFDKNPGGAWRLSAKSAVWVG
jgi:hypothetical protein